MPIAKTVNSFDKKEEYYAVDVEGSPVIIVTCCSYIHCDAYVTKLKHYPFLDTDLTPSPKCVNIDECRIKSYPNVPK